MAVPPTTVATPALQNLNPVHIKPNLDPVITEQMFKHAMKIFVLSYPEFDQNMLNDEVYYERFQEYMEMICELFEYAEPMDMIEDRLKNLWTELLPLPICVVVTVKKLLGRDKAALIGLSAAMMNPATNQVETSDIDLDLTREEQLDKQLLIPTIVYYLKVCKQRRVTLYIRPYGHNWAPDVAQQPFHTFTITLDRIHGEGYQEWFEFGRGVKVLFEITFFFVTDTKSVEAKTFHMYAIYQMLEKVVERHTPANPLQFVWHKDVTRINTYVNFQRPAVDSKEDRFWRQMPSDEKAEVFEKLAELANDPTPKIPTSLRQLIRHSVSFIDLHRDQLYGPDIEERVCLCSQFCNWTAFFHYNPIYRFVILQNSQLFFNFVGNVSDIYLFNVLELLTKNNPFNSYMFPLMHSANHYHQKIISELYPDANFLNEFDNSHPLPFDMSGVTYNRLRNEILVPEILGRLEQRPSGELVIRGLKQFSEVLSHLHHFCSLNTNFVPIDRQYVWIGEFSQVIHSLLAKYLPYIYTRGFNPAPLQTILPLNDYIFGSDIEYQSYIPKNEAETEVKYIRLKALQSGQNPLNVRVRLSPLFAAFVWFYKFVTAINPLFALPENKQGWNIVDGQCVKFDQDFYAHFNSLNQGDKDTLFSVTAHDLVVNGIDPQMRPHFYALYTLKLFSIAQVIQRHCIKIRDKKLKRMENQWHPIWEQFSDSFRFILYYEWIVQPLRSLTGNELFTINTAVLIHRIDQFYITYWGKAPHEVLTVPPIPDFLYCANSALNEYFKHFVWLSNGGSAKNKLVVIRHTFVLQLRHHLTVAQEILSNFRHVHQFLKLHKVTYVMETMDVLFIYLVRAICVMVIDNVAALFLPTHASIESRHLTIHRLSFAMSKPGWIIIFETDRYAFEVLDMARIRYIDFDDESERMLQSLEDSRMSVKAMYQHYYYYLCRQCLDELYSLNALYRKLPPAADTLVNEEMVATLLQMHFTFSITFMARFHRSYRFNFYTLRKVLAAAIATIIDYNQPQKRFTHRMRNCKPALVNYLRDIQAVETTQVFDSQVWINLFNQYMPPLLGIQPNQVGLDMAAANSIT